MYSTEYILKELNKLTNMLVEKSELNLPSVHKIEKMTLDPMLCKSASQLLVKKSTLGNILEFSNEADVKSCMTTVLEQIKSFETIYKEKHEGNLKLINENKKAVSALREILKHFGIYEEYTDYSLAKPKSKKSGYNEDITRAISLDDNYSFITSKIYNLKNSIIEYAKNLCNEIRKKEAEELRKKLQEKLVYLSVKYNLGKIGTPDELCNLFCANSGLFSNYYEYYLDECSLNKDYFINIIPNLFVDDDYDYSYNLSLIEKYMKEQIPDIFNDFISIRDFVN